MAEKMDRRVDSIFKSVADIKEMGQRVDSIFRNVQDIKEKVDA